MADDLNPFADPRMQVGDGQALSGDFWGARAKLMQGERTPTDPVNEPVLRAADKAILDLAQPGRDIGDWVSQQRGPTPPGLGAVLPSLGMAAMNVMPGPRTAKAAAEVAPPFFSMAQKVINESALAKAAPGQWLGTLKNAGVKPEELAWTGVEDWLKGQQGAVSKDALADFMRSNQVEVKPVLRGEAAAQNATDEYHQTLQSAMGLTDRINEAQEAGRPEAEIRALMREQDQLWQQWQTQNPQRAEAKFGQYTLPGGENYGEMLLTLPNGATGDMRAAGARAADMARQLREKYGERYLTDAPAAELKAYERVYQQAAGDGKRNDPFVSPHWEEPNVLAHVRFDDRTIDGEKTLHMAELQSDWHQKGRKVGYQTGDAPVQARQRAIMRRLDEIQAEAPPGMMHHEMLEWLPKHSPHAEEYNRLFTELETNAAAERAEKQRIPDAPFKTTWPELSLKRMIRHAAENGYDRISWDTGATNAERYDLSKQIKEVRFEKAGLGGFTPREHIEGETAGTLQAFDHDGRKVIDQYTDASRLPDYIGKDAADKLLAQRGEYSSGRGTATVTHSLSGLDLKVGGEGMKGFYDKMLPAAANKLGKKFGAKVESSNIDKPPYEDLTQRDVNGRPAWKFESTPVHSMKITPELRKAAMSGFPLFAKGGRVKRYAEGGAPDWAADNAAAPDWAKDTPAATTAASPSQSVGEQLAFEAKGIPRGIAKGLGSVPSLMARGMDPELAASMWERGEDPYKDVIQPNAAAMDKRVADTIEAINNKTGMLPQGGKYGETLGEFVGNPLSYIGPGGLMAKAATAAAAGLGSEAAGQLAEGTGAEPYARLAGAVVGAKGPSAAMRAVTPLPISAERQALVNTLRAEGVEPTAGQVSGSRALKYAESELGDAPLAGGKATAAQHQQAQQYSRAALRRIGEDADAATPEVMQRAATRIGNDFDTLAARNSAPYDPQYFHDLSRARQDYQHLLLDPLNSAKVDHVFEQQINNMIQNRSMAGDLYKSQRSMIDRMRRSETNPEVRNYLADIRQSMDDLMERSIAANNPRDLGAWRQTRNQYRNMLVLERASAGGGEQAAEGLVSPARLRQAVISVDRGPRNYARGIGDYADMARAGNAVMTPLPQSGTAPRMWARAVPGLIGAALGAPGGLHGATLGAAAGAIAAPAIAGRTLMSRGAQNYLKNQLLANALRNMPPTTARSVLSASANEINRRRGGRAGRARQ